VRSAPRALRAREKVTRCAPGAMRTLVNFTVAVGIHFGERFIELLRTTKE
jgi:hypothetical protein